VVLNLHVKATKVVKEATLVPELQPQVAVAVPVVTVVTGITRD
jgi:hypothetical protein